MKSYEIRELRFISCNNVKFFEGGYSDVSELRQIA